MAFEIDLFGRFRVRHLTRTESTPLGPSHVPVIKIRCPVCGVFADVDDDQWRGRVSVECVTPGCTFHETHNFALMELAALTKDDPGGPYVQSYDIGPKT